MLDRRIEQHVAAPVLKLFGKDAVHVLRISAHRLWLERDAKRASVHAVMVEIHQHQPAREQQIQDRTPALFGREKLLAVKQQKLIRLCTHKRDRRIAKSVGAENLAISVDHMRAISRRIAQHAECCADNRRAILARNMREVTNLCARHPMRVGSFAMGKGH